MPKTDNSCPREQYASTPLFRHHESPTYSPNMCSDFLKTRALLQACVRDQATPSTMSRHLQQNSSTPHRYSRVSTTRSTSHQRIHRLGLFCESARRRHAPLVVACTAHTSLHLYVHDQTGAYLPQAPKRETSGMLVCNLCNLFRRDRNYRDQDLLLDEMVCTYPLHVHNRSHHADKKLRTPHTRCTSQY